MGHRLLGLLLVSPGPLGEVARAVDGQGGEFLPTKRWQQAEQGLPSRRELLPLPCWLFSVEELCAGGVPAGYAKEERALKERRVKIEDVHGWVQCMVTAVNYMDALAGKVQARRAHGGAPPSQAQLASVGRFHWWAAYVAQLPDLVPATDWRKHLGSHRLTYQGELVQRAVPLEFDGVIASLPPRDLSGKINCVDLAEGTLKEQLLNPELSLKPRSEWPSVLKQPKVRASQAAWDRIAAACVERSIFEVVPPEQVWVHNGVKLLNGAFGIKKGKKKWSEEAQCWVEGLRLIINLTASNELQLPIQGDVRSLPFVCQWLTLELLEDEMLLWAAEDLECCFYLFGLPPCWLPLFVLEKQVSGEALRLEPGMHYVAVRVLPMGWLSAVGVCQYLHRRLLTLPPPRGAGLPVRCELRKDMAPPSGSSPFVKRFFQVYIDNWDSGEVVKLDFTKQSGSSGAAEDWDQLLTQLSDEGLRAGPLAQQAWQQRVRQAYKHWGAARSEDKAVTGELLAHTLGGTIDGEAGRAHPNPPKLAELFSLVQFVLQDAGRSEKLMALIAGKLVFMLQFRRPLLCLLQVVWREFGAGLPGSASRGPADEELLATCCCLRFVQLDFRRPASGCVTCSDASEEGVGGCRAKSLTSAGLRLAASLCKSGARGRDSVCLIEAFGGIGGGRRSLELLGIEVSLYVHIENSPAARRVARHHWPEAVELEDVADFNEEFFRRVLANHVHIKLVLVIGGPPCQDVAGVNASRLGVEGPRSSLVWHMPRLAEVARRVLPQARVGLCTENVASMSPEDQKTYDLLHGCLPVRACPEGLGWMRRPRLFWLNWPLVQGSDFTVTESARWTEVVLQGTRAPVGSWLPKNYKLEVPTVVFHTFMRSIPRKAPPLHPAGLSKCSEATQARWTADSYRYPPYQYSEEFLVRSPSGIRTLLPARGREVLLGFAADHTYHCWPAAARKADPDGWEDERCSLLGNTFACQIVAWLCAHFFVEAGVLTELPSATALSRSTCMGGPLPELVVDGEAQDPENKPASSVDLVRALCLRQHYRGGELRRLLSGFGRRCALRASVDPGAWQWATVISGRWKQKEHINALEGQAVAALLRWRCRSARHHRHRILHLTDSAVIIGALSKGRTSSRRLRPVLLRVAACSLAGDLQVVLAHVRSHRNPADRPSRNTKVQQKKVSKPGPWVCRAAAQW